MKQFWDIASGRMRHGVTRRGFIAAGAAFAASGAARASADMEAPALRVGILSDIHVTALANANWFEKALRLFDAQKVDAVLIAGDLTVFGKKDEFEAVASTWRKVFPGDRRSDGVHVEKLFITGNHDVDAIASSDAKRKKKYRSYEDVKKTSFFANRNALWRELFGEEYAPVVMKTVKGHTFILRNWHSRLSAAGENKALLPPDFAPEKNPASTFIAENAGKLPAVRPFFYVQHEPLPGTVCHKKRTAKDRFDRTGTALAAFPNCLAFTGHSHFTLTDERSIWQGAFTALNCSCARGYAFSPPGRENGHSGLDFNRNPPFEMAPFDFRSVRQAMTMDAFADRISFRRLDIVNDMPLGNEWVVPLFDGRAVPPSGTPKYGFSERFAASAAPQFAPEAKVSVKEIANGRRRAANGRKMDSTPRRQIVASFPPIASSASSGRGYDFSVAAEMRQPGDTSPRTVQEKRVFSPNFCMAESMEVAPVACAFAYDAIPKNCDIRFTVRPFNCWGKAGREICSDWIRFS